MIKLWDTKQISVGIGRETVVGTNAWNNIETWEQIYTTDHIFSGDAIIETNAYWLIFWAGTDQRPTFVGKITATIPQRTSEIYGKRIMGTSVVWNVWQNLSGLRINENNNNIVNITMTAGSYGNAFTNQNIITYIARADINTVEIIPETSNVYDMALHASPNRQGVAVANDGASADQIMDKNNYPYPLHNEVYSLYADSAHNKMLVQELISDGSRSQYILIPKHPDTANLVMQSYWEGYPRFGSMRSNVQKDQLNDRVYMGTNPTMNIFWTYDVNSYMAQESTYNTGRVIGDGVLCNGSPCTVNGIWKIVGRMKVGGVQTHYSQTLLSGPLIFTAPVSGTLEVLTVYLYDRTAETLSNIKTPMDIYKETICQLPQYNYTILQDIIWQ